MFPGIPCKDVPPGVALPVFTYPDVDDEEDVAEAIADKSRWLCDVYDVDELSIPRRARASATAFDSVLFSNEYEEGCCICCPKFCVKGDVGLLNDDNDDDDDIFPPPNPAGLLEYMLGEPV